MQVASTLRDDIPVNPGTTPVTVVPRTLPPDIRDGVKWLTENQQPDGSWSDLALTSERDTSEAVYTLRAFPSADTQFQAGLQWLGNSSSANTDYLARRLAVCGTPDECLEQLLAAKTAGAKRLMFTVSLAADPAMTVDLFARKVFPVIRAA